MKKEYPKKASYAEVIQNLEAGGFVHVYTGKTRESFINPEFPDLLYILATDRISIFDIVLDARVPKKGAVLTAMTVHWLTKVFAHVPNHLVAFGKGIEEYVPIEFIMDAYADDLDYLMKHMIVVKNTQVLKVEAIVRGFLTGSGFKGYKETGKICGWSFPAGLKDGSELPAPLFTPSTKADYGSHDENISFKEACMIIGEDNARFIRDKSIYLYTTAKEIAREADITIADTKFEFGVDKGGSIILIDEVLTPDSSRFWPEKERQPAMAEGKTPPSLDKQPIRNAGEAAGVKKDHSWIPPKELLDEASESYQKICKLMVGKPLQAFWLEDMGIEEYVP